MRVMPLAFDQLAEPIAILALVVLFGIAAVGLVGRPRSDSIWRIGRRLRSTRKHEVLFVGRWGGHGPELFVVGKSVRPIVGPGNQHREHEAGAAVVALARGILAEVMGQRPAMRLAYAFAWARLTPLPSDGLVMSAAEVEAWLDARSDEDEASEASTPLSSW